MVQPKEKHVFQALSLIMGGALLSLALSIPSASAVQQSASGSVILSGSGMFVSGSEAKQISWTITGTASCKDDELQISNKQAVVTIDGDDDERTRRVTFENLDSGYSRYTMTDKHFGKIIIKSNFGDFATCRFIGQGLTAIEEDSNQGRLLMDGKVYTMDTNTEYTSMEFPF